MNKSFCKHTRKTWKEFVEDSNSPNLLEEHWKNGEYFSRLMLEVLIDFSHVLALTHAVSSDIIELMNITKIKK